MSAKKKSAPPVAAKNARIGVVLAAGKGQRMGGPKALLAWPRAGVRAGHPPIGRPEPSAEVPLAVAHAEALLVAGCDRVLVVTRAPWLGPLLSYAHPGIDLVVSDFPDELGPAGTLACATQRIEGASLVVVVPVDMPPVRTDTVARLCARLEEADAPLAARPRYGGHRGHPVALRPAALEPYRTPPAGGPPPLRHRLHDLGERCVDVDVDDGSIRIDLDTAGDVKALLGAPPRFCG